MFLLKRGGFYTAGEIDSGIREVQFVNLYAQLHDMVEKKYIVRRKDARGKWTYGVTSDCVVPMHIPVAELSEALV